MFTHVEASLHVICVVAALIFFGIAAFWPAPAEPYRTRIIGAGLFFLTLSILV